MSPKRDRVNRRGQILTAVHHVLGEEGFDGVTMKSVAAAAGVSYGLLHYYFKSKEDMLVAAMRQSVAVMLDVHAASFSRMQPGDDTASTILRDFRSVVGGSPEHFNIFLECWPLTRHTSSENRALGQELFDQVVSAIRLELEKLEQRGVIKPSMHTAHLAVMLVALFDGLSFQADSRPGMLSDEKLWATVENAIRPWLHADRDGG